MPAPNLPHVLFVDDEPQVLQGIALTLRRAFAVTTAESGEAAVELLRRGSHFAVIVSDMRMPGMSGATFLAHARALSPTSVRLLLTGHSDLMSAVSAINEGQIFRFLTKPCPPETLTRILHEALEQSRLINAEKELLEKTVLGSVKALTDLLAIAAPEAFARAARIKRVAMALAEAAQLPEKWPLELAAMACQIGSVSVPQPVLEKMYRGTPLSSSEREMAEKAPALTRQIIGNIPRLEKVVEILDQVVSPSPTMTTSARILRIAAAYDTLEALGLDHAQILARLVLRRDELGARLIELLDQAPILDDPGREVAKLRVADLRVGMTLAADLQAVTGTLIVPRGHEISAGSLARIKNFARSTALKEPVEVYADTKSRLSGAFEVVRAS